MNFKFLCIIMCGICIILSSVNDIPTKRIEYSIAALMWFIALLNFNIIDRIDELEDKINRKV